MRTTRIAPLVSELESWMRGEWARLFRHADVAKAMDYTVPLLNIVRTSPLGNDRIRRVHGGREELHSTVADPPHLLQNLPKGRREKS